MNKTSKTLAVVSLILVILSFVGITLFFSSDGILTNTGSVNETVEVTIEDGKVVTEPLIEEFKADKDTFYSFDYSWNATEDRHITGLVIRDEDGKALDYATGDTTEGVMEGTLDKGDYTIEFIFMANEEEVRSFFEENVPDMSEEDLDKFIEGIDFDAIPDNCTTVVTYNMDISKSAFDSRIGMVIALAITVAAIISLLLLRAKYKGDEELKGRLTAIGPSYAAFGIIVTLTQFAISLIASLAFPELLRDHQILVSMLLIVVSVDLIGLPAIWMLLKKVEISKPEKTKFSIVKLIKYICISATLTGIGAIVGTIFELILSGTPNNEGLTDLLSGSNIFVRALVVGILAPIVEELIFRKLLVDRTRKYGDFAAILLSGLMFGLFHGNFSQFFYAMLLGFFWAYIYTKTGNIWYTILLHMAINLTNSVITSTLAMPYIEALDKYGDDIDALADALVNDLDMLISVGGYMLWVLFLCAIAFAGFIIILVSVFKGQFKINKKEGELSFATQAKICLTSPYMWVFYATCLGLFLMYYLPNYL